MKNELWIDEKTAQLVLDAIGWCNKDWVEAIGMDMTDDQIIEQTRQDFVRFCDARGISGVEKQIELG